MPTGSQTGQPPLPPDVKQQQSPAEQYAQGAASSQVQPENAGKEFVMQGFKKIAEIMQKQVSVLQSDAPELMPYMIKAVQALQMVEKEFSKLAAQGQGPAQPGSEPQVPQAEGPGQLGA